MTDEELNKTLIARLRKVDEYEPLGHDGWEAADRIEQLVATNEALVKARREDALELIAAHGQAQEAYEAQLKAEARAERLEARCKALIAAYYKANWLRTADYHGDECDCLRCHVDHLDAALKGADHE